MYQTWRHHLNWFFPTVTTAVLLLKLYLSAAAL